MRAAERKIRERREVTERSWVLGKGCGERETGEEDTEGIRMVLAIASSAGGVGPCHPALLAVSLMLVVALRGRQEKVRGWAGGREWNGGRD